MSFASGKYAYGFCDRCGFRYPYHDLIEEYVDDAPTNIRVCPICWDPDHPQNKLGQVNMQDPQALEHPRPDQDLAETADYFAWDPVGGGVTQLGSRTVGLDMIAKVGRVRFS